MGLGWRSVNPIHGYDYITGLMGNKAGAARAAYRAEYAVSASTSAAAGHAATLGAKAGEQAALQSAAESVRYMQNGGVAGSMGRGISSGYNTVMDNTLRVPGKALKTGGKWALIGGVVAGAALVASNMGLFGKSKSGKDSAIADGELEASARDSMVMRAEDMLPAPTLMGEKPMPGEMASKVRPHGPMQLGVDSKDPSHGLAI